MFSHLNSFKNSFAFDEPGSHSLIAGSRNVIIPPPFNFSGVFENASLNIVFRSYVAHITSKWCLYALEALLPQL